MTEPGATTVVRSRYFAVRVPDAAAPLDTVHFAVFHPAVLSGTPEEIQTGVLPPDDAAAPWPLLIWLGGINVNPQSYQWLAVSLARAGIATVTFSHVAEISPGSVGLSPGLDLSALGPDTAGTRPSATVIGPVLEAFRRTVDADLAERVDLDSVVIGGHSAGGTVALLNAHPEWFAGVRGAISYAGHTRPAALLGHAPGTILPVPGDVPALVMGGTDDGIIAASASRYDAVDDQDHDPLRATFEHATTAAGSVLALIEGGNHETICHPVDPCSARGFLEPDHDAPVAHRDLIGSLVTTFIRAAVEPGLGDDRWPTAGAPADLREFRLR